MTAETQCLQRFKELFNQMGAGEMPSLRDVYSPNTCFEDPFVAIDGLPALVEYFTNAYANVIECSFTFSDSVTGDRQVALPWVMHLRHRRIRGGARIDVQGISHLVIEDGLITYHRDYFDAGQLLYENVPVIGSAIRWLRKHAA